MEESQLKEYLALMAAATALAASETPALDTESLQFTFVA
jgi:hypothetical protein